MAVIQASRLESEPADREVWVFIFVWLDYPEFMRFPIWGSSLRHAGLCSHLFINNNVTNQYNNLRSLRIVVSSDVTWLLLLEIIHLKYGPLTIFDFFSYCDSCWLNLRIKSVDLWIWLWAFTLILKLSPTLNVKGELRRCKLSRTLEYLGN